MKIGIARAMLLRKKSRDTEDLFRIHDLARERGGRDRERSGEIDLCLHTAFTSLEIAGCRGDADFAVGKKAHFRLAHAASRRDDLRAGFEQCLDEPGLDA